VDSLDFDNLIIQIGEVAAAFNGAADAAARFVGETLGFDGIGRDIVNMLPGDGASKSFFGGGLTVTSTSAITDRINQAFEGEIKKAGELTSDAVKNSVLGNLPTLSKGGRIGIPDEVKPVSLSDFAAPDGKGKGKKSRLDDYQRELAQMRERIANLNAETAAQS